MMQFFSAIMILGVLFSMPALSADQFKITQANLSFDTFVRVEMPGKIIESDDVTHVGSPLSYLQSLRYSASKVLPLNRTFTTAAEIEQFAETVLCLEVHSLELKPIRDGGVKGTRSLNVNMKPKTILLIGSQVSNKGAPISSSFICR